MVLLFKDVWCVKMKYIIKSPDIKSVDDKFIPINNIDKLNVYIKLKNEGLNVETYLDNLKTLKIKRKLSKKKEAGYDFINNKILIRKYDYKNDITHELLHAATTILDENGIHSGFMFGDWISKDVIGLGLNEGMTAYLDLKYFGDYTKTKRESEKYVYPMMKAIIRNLCSIIPEKDLIEYYTNSDLAGLIYDLNMLYDDASYILDFLGSIDTLYYKNDLPKIICEDDLECIISNYIFVKTFLAESIYIVANAYYENNLLSKENFEIEKDKVKKILGGIINIDGKVYNASNIEEYENIEKRYVLRKQTGKKIHA